MNIFKFTVIFSLLMLLAACGGNGVKSASTQQQVAENVGEGKWVQVNILAPTNYGQKKWVTIRKEKGQYLILRVQHENGILVFRTDTNQEDLLYHGNTDGFINEEVVLLRQHENYRAATGQGAERIYYCVTGSATDECSTEDLEDPTLLASL